MEGLMNTSSDLGEKVADRLQSTFVGRTFSAVDRAIKVTGDIGSRSLTSGTLDNRGYRVLGFNQHPEIETGLSLEMKEVQHCAYKDTATPFLNELRNITARQPHSRAPGPGLVLGGGQRRIRIVVPEQIRSPEEVELYHSWKDRRPPAEEDIPAPVCFGRGRAPATMPQFPPHQGPGPPINLARPFADYEATLAGLPQPAIGEPIPEALPVPQARVVAINGECLIRQASLGKLACEHGFGRVKDTAKVVGHSFYNRLPDKGQRERALRVGGYPILGCAGVHDLTVCDITINEWTIAKCSGIIDKQFGKNVNPPAHYFQQAMAAVSGAVAKSMDGRSSSQKESYLRLDSLDVEEQYHNSIKLLMCAMYLNKVHESARSVTHWDFIDSDYIARVKSEESRSLSWFPPGNGPQSPAQERLEKSLQKLIELTGDSENVIPVLPARMMEGTAYEAMTVTQSDEQREELQKLVLAREGEPPMRAMHCGPNLTGAPCAIDTGAVETWMSGYTRHYNVLDKKIPLPDNTELHIMLDKSHSRPKDLSKAEIKCWADMTAQHKQLFRNWLQCVHTYSAIPDIRPNSMALEVFEALKAEVLWDTEWGFKTLVRTAVFNKSKELPASAMARARQISQPGCNCDDAKLHQAISSPIIQMIEKFHLQTFNFRNFKGASFTGRGLRVARHIAQTGEDTVTIGYDKAANDRTWSWAKWCKFEDYCMVLAKEICLAYFEEHFPGLLPAGPGSAESAEWRSALLTVTADIIYYFLQSGINPTALANRMGGDCSVGAGILTGYGAQAYDKWLHWCGGYDATAPPELQIELFFPFVADGIPVLENLSNGCFTHRNEGDDTGIEIICRTLKGGKRETYSEAVSYFTRAICDTTKEAWEPAVVSTEHLNRHGGPKSVVEIMSFVVECDVVDGKLEFAQVPKPLKKLDKMAWTISQWFIIKDGPFGKLGVKNAVYHRENATRCFSMCLELRHCMFVRWVIYKTGEHHLYQLRKLSAASNPDGFKPLYNGGSMEARMLPDALGYLGGSLNDAHQRIGDRFRDTDCSTDIVLSTNACAWAFHTPEVIRKGNGAWLRQTLLGLDETARMIDITEEHIVNPVTYLCCLDLGALASTFARVVERLGESEKSKWDSSIPLHTISAALISSVKYSGTNVVNAQSQRRATPASQQKPTDGALEGSDKGQLDSAVSAKKKTKGTSASYDPQERSWSNTPNRTINDPALTSEHYVLPAWPPVTEIPEFASSSAAAVPTTALTPDLGAVGSGAGLDFRSPPGAVGAVARTEFSSAQSSSHREPPSHRGFGSVRW